MHPRANSQCGTFLQARRLPWRFVSLSSFQGLGWPYFVSKMVLEYVNSQPEVCTTDIFKYPHRGQIQCTHPICLGHLMPTVKLSRNARRRRWFTYLIAYIARRNPLKYSSLTGNTIGSLSLDPWLLPSPTGNENIVSKVVPGTSNPFLGTRNTVFSTYSSSLKLHNPKVFTHQRIRTLKTTMLKQYSASGFPNE